MSPALRDVFAPELSAVPLRQPFTVLDGGLSTALEELGESPVGPLWAAAPIVDRPSLITAAHRRYVDAGADVIITSSYQASEAGLVAAGLEPTAARRVLASTTAVARASGAAIVACSIGPFGACLADGSEYHGRYSATWSQVRAFHRARLEVLVETEPDLFAIETVPTAIEAEIIVDVLRSLTTAPAWVSFSCKDDAHTCGGELLSDAVARVVADVDAIGVNCTAPHMVAPLLRSLSVDGPLAVPLLAYPNHGAHWNADLRNWAGHAEGSDIPGLVPSWIAAGARIIGGCCGVGSSGIAELVAVRASLAN